MERPYLRSDLNLPPELKTERLLLRPIKVDDYDCIWELDSDPEIMEYVMPPSTDKLAHHKQFLEDIKKGTRYHFFRLLTCIDTGESLGWAFARPTENGDWVELGYRLKKKTWGKGFMPEAMKALIEIILTDWGIVHVMALIDDDNLKSERVVKKLGFEYDKHVFAYNINIRRFIRPIED